MFVHSRPRPSVGVFSFWGRRSGFSPAVAAAIGAGTPACAWSAARIPCARGGPRGDPRFRGRRIVAGLLLLLVALCLASCSRDTTPARVGTKAGAEPGGRSEVRRIVSLAPNLTEILFALGLGERVVGVTEYCNYPPEALRLPRVGGFVNPNPETIIALRPDLVLATPNVGNRPFVERVMAVGARVEVVQARNVEEIFPAIEAIAAACGVGEAGRTLVSRLREQLDSAAARVGALRPPRVLFCIQVDPLVAAGPGSYPADLLKLAGGDNIVPVSAGAYPSLSLEEVVRSAPEVIVQSLMDTRDGAGGASALLAYWSRWPSIPAVRNRRVHTLAGDVVLRPGPRVVEGVGALIALIHPEAAP